MKKLSKKRKENVAKCTHIKKNKVTKRTYGCYNEERFLRRGVRFEKTDVRHVKIHDEGKIEFYVVRKFQ